MKEIRTKDREPVDLALWRTGHRRVADVEAAFDTTRRLAAKPLDPPAGTLIRLPEKPPVAVIKTVKLWD